MLTVKHIKEDGSEAIYACEHVIYRPDRGRPEDFGIAGLYLDPIEPDDAPCDLSGNIAVAPRQYSAANVIPISRCRSAGNPEPTAFVMNEKGATIARYSM